MKFKLLIPFLLVLWSGPLLRADRPVAVFLELEGPSVAELDLAAAEHIGARPAAVPTPSSDRLAAIRRQQAALEPLLVPLEAKITGRFGILVNAVRVRVLESRIPALRALPGVVRVQRVHQYKPDLESSVPWIGAPAAWAGTAGGLAGAGIRIGIIDSGIDYYHADFGGRGRAADHENDDPRVIEPGSFPTAKVVGGTDFVGDDYDASNTAKDTPVPDPDPLDTKANGHGSHVAGIAAGLGVLADGSTYTGAHDSKVDFTRFKIGPGVAPDAKLYALKVFGRSGSTDAVTDALDRAADPDDDGRTTDHLDVVNLSLGGDFGSYDAADVELKAVDRLARLGCVVVVSAGNAGDTHYILGSPGLAPRAITVANSIDNGTSTLDLRVLSPASIATNYPAVEGAVTVTAPLADVGPRTAQVVATSPADACGPLSNTAALKGKIALIDRGDCLFGDKIAKAQAAGAIGVIMVNNQDGPPIPMGGKAADPITIPGVMISKADGALLRAHLIDGVTATLSSAIVTVHPELADQIEESSSRGPTYPDNRLKPDLAAPGSSIRSAESGGGSSGVVFSGTSMSAPHVSGAAALLKQAHPTWPVDDIKAALMGTTVIIHDADGHLYPKSRAGAGRLQVDAAAATAVVAKADNSLGEVSISFGLHELSGPLSLDRSVRVVNHGGSPVTFDLTVATSVAEPGITITPSVPTITVPANGATSVGFRLDADPSRFVRTRDLTAVADIGGVPRPQLPESSGDIWLRGGGTSLHVPWHIVARAASQIAVTATHVGLPAGPTGTLTLPGRGRSAHSAPLVAAFQLGLAKAPVAFTPVGASTDVLAIGAASDIATAGTMAAAKLYFGIATAGHWSTPNRAANDFDVEIDLDGDSMADFTLINGNTGTFGVGDVDSYDDSTDALETVVRDEATGRLVGSRPLDLFGAGPHDAALFANGVMVHSAAATDIGISATRTRFRYRVLTRGEFDDTTDWVAFDAAKPAIDTTSAGIRRTPYFDEASGVTLGFDRANAKAGGFTDAVPPRALLIHVHNLSGKHADVVVLDLATSDVDADGMDDGWELAHFGDLSHTGAEDSDGDGATDRQEFLAGSDPLDPATAFRLSAQPATSLAGTTRLRWASTAGRTYAVERAARLPGPFTAVRTGIRATPPQNESDDLAPTSDATVFYRIRVE